MRSHEVRHVVVNGRADEQDMVLQQPRIDVVGSLTAIGLFDHHGDERRGVRSWLDRILHLEFLDFKLLSLRIRARRPHQDRWASCYFAGIYSPVPIRSLGPRTYFLTSAERGAKVRASMTAINSAPIPRTTTSGVLRRLKLPTRYTSR